MTQTRALALLCFLGAAALVAEALRCTIFGG